MRSYLLSVKSYLKRKSFNEILSAPMFEPGENEKWLAEKSKEMGVSDFQRLLQNLLKVEK